MSCMLQQKYSEMVSALALTGEAEAVARRAFYVGATAVLETLVGQETILDGLEAAGAEITLHFAQEKRRREAATGLPDAVLINDSPIDFLTVRFWRDQAGPLCPNPPPPEKQLWCAQVGPDLVTGVGGFGKTPLLALHDLLENIAQNEGHKSDLGKFLIR